MRVLVPIADGVEDIETVTIIDVLRRAGITVDVASIHDRLEVTAARGCRLIADGLLAEQPRDYALIALPGGLEGARHFGACAALIERLHQQRSAGRPYAAICASPALALAPHGLLDGVQATAYPSFQDRLPQASSAPVVHDGLCITSQGPGTALAFALTLVERLCGPDQRQELAAQLLVA